MIYSGTIINDGRKLMMSALPITYLAQPVYARRDTDNAAFDGEWVNCGITF